MCSFKLAKYHLYFRNIAIKKVLCVLAVFSLCIMSGCSNKNPYFYNNISEPNIDNNISEPTMSYADNSMTEKAIPEYINADDLAHRSYELHFLLAQKEFNSPEDISVNALVQYAFCHLFFDNLTDMPRSGNKLRHAAIDEIKHRIAKDFGKVNTDITKSDLYNAGNKLFEMWQPHYGTEIFFDVSLIRVEADTYKTCTTFYKDSSKKEVMGKTVLTVHDSNGQVIITKMTSSN